MKTINVYIITEEGRSYTTEGLKYLTGVLEKEFNVKDQLAFLMGWVYNDPDRLIESLKTYPDSYVVVSKKDGIGFVPPDQLDAICEALEDLKPNTSWETLVEITTPHS